MAKIKVGLWVGVVALIALGVGLVADRAQSASADRICFEAENAKTVTEYFVKRTAPFKDKKNRVSSGGYIEIVEEIHKAKGLDPGEKYYPGTVTYEVNVPSAGSYTFWARTWWNDAPIGQGCSNSFWVQIGGQTDQILGEDGTYGVWEWRKPKHPPFTLPAGKVTLTFKDHEDGIRIDQICLVKGTFVPVGKMLVTPGALAH
jgi:hypothetical protein